MDGIPKRDEARVRQDCKSRWQMSCQPRMMGDVCVCVCVCVRKDHQDMGRESTCFNHEPDRRWGCAEVLRSCLCQSRFLRGRHVASRTERGGREVHARRPACPCWDRQRGREGGRRGKLGRADWPGRWEGGWIINHIRVSGRGVGSKGRLPKGPRIDGGFGVAAAHHLSRMWPGHGP